MITGVNHIAIICKTMQSIAFYEALGFTVTQTVNRGYDQIVWMKGYGERLEIFIDPTHPAHVTDPEAYGLRHLAFCVEEIEAVHKQLEAYRPEPIKVKGDGKRVFFVKDPDGLPIEFCE